MILGRSFASLPPGPSPGPPSPPPRKPLLHPALRRTPPPDRCSIIIKGSNSSRRRTRQEEYPPSIKSNAARVPLRSPSPTTRVPYHVCACGTVLIQETSPFLFTATHPHRGLKDGNIRAGSVGAPPLPPPPLPPPPRARHLNGRRRPCLLNPSAGVVDQSANPPPGAPRHEHVPHTQRSTLNEHRTHRSWGRGDNGQWSTANHGKGQKSEWPMANGGRVAVTSEPYVSRRERERERDLQIKRWLTQKGNMVSAGWVLTVLYMIYGYGSVVTVKSRPDFCIVGCWSQNRGGNMS